MTKEAFAAIHAYRESKRPNLSGHGIELKNFRTLTRYYLKARTDKGMCEEVGLSLPEMRGALMRMMRRCAQSQKLGMDIQSNIGFDSSWAKARDARDKSRHQSGRASGNRFTG